MRAPRAVLLPALWAIVVAAAFLVVASAHSAPRPRVATVVLWNEQGADASLVVVLASPLQRAASAAVPPRTHGSVEVVAERGGGTLAVTVVGAGTNASVFVANVTYAAGTARAAFSVAALTCVGAGAGAQPCFHVLTEDEDAHLNDGIDVARLRVFNGAPEVVQVLAASSECHNCRKVPLCTLQQGNVSSGSTCWAALVRSHNYFLVDSKLELDLEVVTLAGAPVRAVQSGVHSPDRCCAACVQLHVRTLRGRCWQCCFCWQCYRWCCCCWWGCRCRW
jgi:hypothetical protein